jgi:DNA-binding transcriptional ArsR family regulator
MLADIKSKDIWDILAEPSRLKITLAVASCGTATANEICRDFKASIPEADVHEHIRILIDSGVLLASEESTGAVLSLNAEGLRKHTTPKAIYDYVAGPTAYARQSLYDMTKADVKRIPKAVDS